LLTYRVALAILTALVAEPLHEAGNSIHDDASAAPYAATSKEAYLSSDDLAYVRPGLHVAILGVTNVAPGRSPIVEISMTDDMGQPLDRTGALTPGEISVTFVLGQWDASRYDYVNLTFLPPFPNHDIGGTWTDLAVGHSTYEFRKSLPLDFDKGQTLTLGAYSLRDLNDIIGKEYAAPAALKTFRADGGAPTAVFAAIDTASCNNCHDPISMHREFGPPIQDVRLCVICHTSQMPDTRDGDPRHFKALIHRVHQNKYPGIHVTYPQDVRFCSSCHTATQPDGGIWYTRPSSAACGSCHDDLNFTTGKNHPGGPATDASCASCHQPQGSAEWDAGIQNAHVVPLHSSQLVGYKASIVSVSNAAPGQKITVAFKLQNGDGTPVDPGVYKDSSRGQINILLGGPSSDYTNPGELANGQPFRENASTSTYDAATGLARFTFANAIPATATGTYAVSIETRRPYTLSPAPAKGPTSVNEGAPNQVFYFAVTGTTAAPRRTSVSLAKCNDCHQDLSILFSHGGQRISIEHCVICHNPNGNDAGRRPAGDLAESIHFARLIHRIHTGEELTQDYTVYGFSGATNFNEVTYPGDRRNCLACHVSSAAYGLPLPSTNQVVNAPREYFSPLGPGTAACTGCHDSSDVLSHAYLNTAYFPNKPGVPSEACATCHGTGRDWGVDKVHAR